MLRCPGDRSSHVAFIPVSGTLCGNVPGGRPYLLRSVPYTPPGEDSLWGALYGTLVSARNSPAQNATVQRKTRGSVRHAR